MLNTLRPAHGSTQKRRRLARGDSAGGGSTAGRGTKGQQARTGKGHRYGFEGGQVPLIRRQPKLGGFKKPRRVVYQIVTLERLEKKLENGTYSIDALREQGVIRGRKPFKILQTGTLTKKLVLEVHAITEGAKKAIEKAGGSITVLSA